jgi:hypothetical protein
MAQEGDGGTRDISAVDSSCLQNRMKQLRRATIPHEERSGSLSLADGEQADDQREVF